MKNKSSDKGDALTWDWRKGAATNPTALGDPLATDDYAFCIYDESGITPATAYSSITRPGCGGKSCWSTRASGFAFHGPGDLCGVRSLDLRAGGDGAARMTLKAKGTAMPAPPLPLLLPARVQLVASNGECWEAEYTTAGVLRNDGGQFNGRGD